MTADYVLNLYNWLGRSGVGIWIDGGWCVDALLGEQTRDHSDLDIAVARRDNPKLLELLEDDGYHNEMRKDSTDWMYAMRGTHDEVVDIHVFEYDEDGKNIYGVEYPYGSLTGEGVLNDQTVNCIAAEWMFKFKTAYPPKDKDLRDVQALAGRYGFELPASHRSSPEK